MADVLGVVRGRRFLRGLVCFIAGFLLSVVAGLAFAEDYAAIWSYSPSGGVAACYTAGSHTSAGSYAACELANQTSPNSSYHGPNANGQVGCWETRYTNGSGGVVTLVDPPSATGSYTLQCRWLYADNTTSTWFGQGGVDAVRWCPGGGTLSGSSCTGAPACATGQTRNASTGLCETACPSGSTLTGGLCVCNSGTALSGYQPRGGSCSCPAGQEGSGGICADPCPKRGGSTYTTGATTGPDSYCSYLNLSGQGYCSQAKSTCLKTASGWQCLYQYDGSRCTQAPSNTPPAAPVAAVASDGSSPDPQSACLAKGMTWGTFNGLGMCVPAGSPGASESFSVQNTTSNVNGTPTTTQQTTQTNADGTVTVTGMGSDGKPCAPGSTCSTTGSAAGICQVNPNLAMCRGPAAAFGGNCDAGFTCEGDAVTCAIAKEQYTRNCALWKDNPQAQLATQVLGGTDPDASKLPGKDNPTNVSLPGQLDTAGFLTAACLSDQTFALPMAGSVTIPWSRLCDVLQMMGSVVLAVSLMVGARIVFA